MSYLGVFLENNIYCNKNKRNEPNKKNPGC